MKKKTRLSRRMFIKASGVMGASFAIGLPLFEATIAETQEDVEINAFIAILADGSALLVAKNPEIGQGVRTSLPMILAEELSLPWNKVQVVSPGWDERLGSQRVVGSQSIKVNYPVLRRAGAAVKSVLVQAAAKRWGTSPDQCHIKDGIISHGKERLHYGLVAQAAAALPLPEAPLLSDPENFGIIGTSVADVDIDGILQGRPLYGIDQKIPGMVYASVLKPEVFGSKVASIDDREAMQVPGVFEVIRIQGRENPTELTDGVAVIAANSWAAMQGKNKLKVGWVEPSEIVDSTDEITRRLRVAAQRGDILREDGDSEKSFAEAEQQELFEAEFIVPWLAHVQLEPVNFIADVKDDAVLLVGSTQDPAATCKQASVISGVTEKNIQLELVRGGGSFGRRLYSDFANEAVYLSQKISRAVQVISDREGDFLSGFFRPAGVYRLRARVRNNRIRALQIDASTTSRRLYAMADEAAYVSEVFPDQFPAGFVPNFRLRYQAVLTNIPQGALRAPGLNATTFAYQCFLDEVAEKLGRDPIVFQLELLGREVRNVDYRHRGGPSYNTERLQQVIAQVRERSGWATLRPRNSFMGFAAQFVSGTYVALVVNLSLRNSKIEVDKITCVVDCGRLINPAGAQAQIQGGIIDALSAALYERITLAKGRLVERNFDTYPKLRMPDAPNIDVHFVESRVSPGGLGEVAYPVVIPALCNAIYAAAGVRIRELPVSLHGLTEGAGLG